MNIKGQGQSLTFIRGHSTATFSVFFYSETPRQSEAKFHMESPWDVRNENLFKCSGHMTMPMPIYDEKLKKSFSLEPRG